GVAGSGILFGIGGPGFVSSSTDDGASWNKVGEPPANFTYLALDSTGTLFGGSANGVYRIQLSPLKVEHEDAEPLLTLRTDKGLTGKTKFSYYLPFGSQVQLEIRDLLGRYVTTL